MKQIWMKLWTKFESPYLKHSARLGDVIGAIQVLGSTPWHAIMPKHWDDFLGKASSTADGKWDEILKEHTEFFRIEENGDAALRWRAAYHCNFNPRTFREYSPEEREALSEEEKKKLHRKPLTPEQIETLIRSATELHARALARLQDVRWWIPLAVGLIGGLLAGLGLGGKTSIHF